MDFGGGDEKKDCMFGSQSVVSVGNNEPIRVH
jgi:hypothetical protein